MNEAVLMYVMKNGLRYKSSSNIMLMRNDESTQRTMTVPSSTRPSVHLRLTWARGGIVWCTVGTVSSEYTHQESMTAAKHGCKCSQGPFWGQRPLQRRRANRAPRRGPERRCRAVWLAAERAGSVEARSESNDGLSPLNHQHIYILRI